MARSVATLRTSLIAAASAWAIFCSAWLGAALQRLGQLAARLGGELLGIGLGGGDDGGSLLLGVEALLLVFGEKRFGVLAELRCVLEFLADPLRAVVEAGGHAS